MSHKLIGLAGVLFLLTATRAPAQQQEAAAPAPLPAATPSEMECSGFIAATPLSNDLYVFDGADNDFRDALHQFATGSYVYIRSRSGSTTISVGSEFSLVRSAKELMRVRWLPGQGGAMRSLGTAYEDVGRAKVIAVTPHGAVAQVTFACGSVRPGDVAIRYQPRPIPEYAPRAPLDRFAPSNGKRAGAIAAATNDLPYVGVGKTVYVNLGQSDGVSPGQRYRVFRIFRDITHAGYLSLPEPPRENIGELVILSVQEKASVGMVVQSIREISLGGGVELE